MSIIQGLNNLQIGESLSWKGLTTDMHLSRFHANDIQTESDIITQIHGAYMGKFGLQTILDKYPIRYLENDADWRWFLRGDMDKAIPIVSFSATDNARPGVANQPFQLVVAENWFSASDHLIFDNRDYSVRIKDNGVSTPLGWQYTVEHMKPSTTFFIPPSLMTAGKKVSRQNNSDTHILGKEYTDTHFTSHFEMRNIFSTASMKYVCPANMTQRKMLIGLKAPDGTISKNWTVYQDLVFEWQWKEMLNAQLMYGEFNQRPDGTYDKLATSGFPIKLGAGLRQQISPTYRYYYNSFNLDYLLEIGLNLSINMLQEDDREFIVATGERGMVMASDAIADKVGIFQPIVLNSEQSRVGGSGQDLRFQGQYKSYWGPQGIKWTFVNMPEYNNAVHNRQQFKNAYSENYRMTIFNVGSKNGEANIQKVMPKNSDKKWYIPGSVNPTGPQTGGMGASPVDGYEYYRRITHGIQLRDPLSACEIIPYIVN